MKIASFTALLLFVSGIILILIQMWFMPFETKLFLKILFTIGLLFIIVLITALVIKEYFEEKSMQDSGHLD